MTKTNPYGYSPSVGPGWVNLRDMVRCLPRRYEASSTLCEGLFVSSLQVKRFFLRLASRDGLSEGQTISVQIQSEARRDKLARVRLTDNPVVEHDAFQTWCEEICPVGELTFVEDRECVAIAFENALEPSVTLIGGGRLHIERTRAMTVMDIDTAGRVSKGSAGARALDLNRTAVNEAARQIGLRGLGGLFVLDCVSPINSGAAERVSSGWTRGL